MSREIAPRVSSTFRKLIKSTEDGPIYEVCNHGVLFDRRLSEWFVVHGHNVSRSDCFADHFVVATVEEYHCGVVGSQVHGVVALGGEVV